MIGRALTIYSIDPRRARFVDKSQSISIKIPFWVSALKEYQPKFVICSRNPYAMCWRAALRTPWLQTVPTMETRVRLAAEHWSNTFAIALRDAEEYGDYHFMRFEDLLSAPSQVAQQIFEYCELEFDEGFLPQAQQKLPLGSPTDEKWYPVRPDVNTSYLRDLQPNVVEIIQARCGALAERFGYEKPR